MSSHPLARSTAGSNNRTKLFLGTVCAVLLAATTAEAKSYKGAEVDSLKSYLYGRVEVRMRMIRGSGVLSTFFTYKNGSEMVNSVWGELDIEVFGKQDAKFWQTNIIAGNPKGNSVEIEQAEKSLADDYHTYTLEWAPEYALWKLDGKEVRKADASDVSDLKDLPMSLRFNTWISDTVSWGGEFDESVLPVYQYVNWIKFYRYEQGQFILDMVDDFDTFDTTRWTKGTWTFGGNLVDFTPNNAVVKDSTLILCVTKENETGFSGTVPVDPEGGAGPGPVASGGSGGSSSSSKSGGSSGSSSSSGGSSGSSSSSGGSSDSSSSSSSSSESKSSGGGCNYGQTSGHGEWAAMILLGLALLGLRSKRSRKN
jgi:beta-glucanase (GH16 family)